jgi:hypothetical protein
MALIRSGSLYDFSIRAKPGVLDQKHYLRNLKTFNALKEVSKILEPDSFELSTSNEQRGLILKSITLTECFEGILGNLFDKTNDVYFLCWVWDLSGNPIIQYPSAGYTPENALIRLKVGNLREFDGTGINLFPKRFIKGGLAIRIQIWESEQSSCNFEKILTKVSGVISKSELNRLISSISGAEAISANTINLIEQAYIELTKSINNILEENSNDYVDYYEGYFASDSAWSPGEDISLANSARIVLSKH